MSAPCNCGACRIRAALDLPLVSGAAIEQETAKRCLNSLAAVAAGLLGEAPPHWRFDFALIIDSYIASGPPPREAELTALHYKFPCEAETAAGVYPPQHRAPAAAHFIRRPTPEPLLHRWHAAALAGEAPEITDAPQCGWFKRRMVKNGPWVPARIWLDQPTDELGELTGDETLRCEVNNREADPQEQWTWIAANPISLAEYRFLSATIAWSAQYAPAEPMANPHQPVDWAKVPTPSF